MKKMTKNEIILITLISLIKSKALNDTVFTDGMETYGETLYETLIWQLDIGKEALAQLVEPWGDGDDEAILPGLEYLLELEREEGIDD